MLLLFLGTTIFILASSIGGLQSHRHEFASPHGFRHGPPAHAHHHHRYGHACARNGQDHNEDKRTIEQIYQAALAEGGNLTIYAGGDAPNQGDWVKQGMEARFPGIKVKIVVDYSKFHDARIDLQLANGALVPDVAILQTLQDFPRWKQEGVLMQYKPANWSKIYRKYRDKDGFYMGVSVVIFSYVVNSQLVPNKTDWPHLATDFLNPIFKGKKLVITYPNDDDAVLFMFKQLIDKYGWSWFEKLLKQDPVFVRGTAVPGIMLRNNTALASLGIGAGSIADVTDGNQVRFAFPADNDPWTGWAQTAAIFKNAGHPETAKLYLNWLLNENNSGRIWSIRTDIPPAQGFRQFWEYPNSNHGKFLAFMQDRAKVEQFKTQIMLYVGEPKGKPAAGVLGTYPPMRN